MAQNISVPDIGDFKDVEVIEVLVKPGDQVNKNDPIVTIESDKSSLDHFYFIIFKYRKNKYFPTSRSSIVINWCNIYCNKSRY